MKIMFYLLTFAALCMLSVTMATGQTVPSLINYQGKLSNADGTPLATADYQLTFKVYDSATNGSGLVWGPQIFDDQVGQGHGSRIPVVQGYFNVMLGPVDVNGALLDTAFTNPNRFVEITIGNRQPILPRQQILSTPYAFQTGNSAKLAGADWSAVFGTNDPANGRIPTAKLATNGTIIAQQIGVGTTNTQGKLEINGEVAIEYGHELQLNSLDNTVASRLKNPANSLREISFVTGAPLAEAMRITQVGNVGIGKTNPATVLDVNGTVMAAAFCGSGTGITGLSVSNMAAMLPSTNFAGIGGVVFSPSTTPFVNVTSTSEVTITNLSLSIATSGRPVMLMLTSDPGNPQSYISESSVSGVNEFTISIFRGPTRLTSQQAGVQSAASTHVTFPPGNFNFLDFTAPAGTNAYSIHVNNSAPGCTTQLLGVRLMAFEL